VNLFQGQVEKEKDLQMGTIDDVIGAPISLHGLGFLQIKLPETYRMHVWHPELPKRSCFEHSQVHDHRFGFRSRVIVGKQRNDTFFLSRAVPVSFSHIAYLHEGARMENGGRPWVEHYEGQLKQVSSQEISVGETYDMLPYVYHSSTALGDGKTVTLMKKTEEHDKGAHSLCQIGVTPDDKFDRYQMSNGDMWEIVADCLTSKKEEQ